jgi:protein farnesyltransferase subunit beta
VSPLDQVECGGRLTRFDGCLAGALQEYVLLAAQAPAGGLRDKPGKGPDAYHTCYNLSGLSSAQHKFAQPSSVVDELRTAFVSPFAGTIVEVESEGEGGEGTPEVKVEVEMVLDEGESEESAETRMREVWARALGWKVVEKVVVGQEEDNEVVSRV